MLYPDDIIHFQLDYSSIHDFRVVQERLSLQADVGIIDWPSRAPYMNPIEYVEWGEEDNAGNMTCPSPPETAMSYGH